MNKAEAVTVWLAPVPDVEQWGQWSKRVYAALMSIVELWEDPDEVQDVGDVEYANAIDDVVGMIAAALGVDYDG